MLPLTDILNRKVIEGNFVAVKGSSFDSEMFIAKVVGFTAKRVKIARLKSNNEFANPSNILLVNGDFAIISRADVTAYLSQA